MRDKVEKRQHQIFRKRIRPNVLTLSEGVNIVRGVRGLKRLVTDANVKWSDIIQFEHPKIPDISIWSAFVEEYGNHLQFKVNPIQDELGFVKELHDFIQWLNGSTINPNYFEIIRRNPEPSGDEPVVSRVLKGDEKLDSEKYPKRYECIFGLRWIVKV